MYNYKDNDSYDENNDDNKNDNVKDSDHDNHNVKICMCYNLFNQINLNSSLIQDHFELLLTCNMSNPKL